MSWGTHLREFHGRLVFRRIVPKNLRLLVGKSEWTRVLGSTDLSRSERNRLEKFEDVKFELAIAEARRKLQAEKNSPSMPAVPEPLPVVDPVQQVPEAVVVSVPDQPNLKLENSERAIPEPPVEVLAVEAGNEDDPPFSALVSEWAKRSEASEKTRLEAVRAVRLFNEVHGDLPISKITKRHVRGFRSVLEKMPKILKADTRKLPLLQIVASAAPGVELISQTTLNKTLGLLSAVLSVGIPLFDLKENPFRGVTFKSKTKNRRLPFDDDDLLNVFKSLKNIERETDYWVIVLGLYTGARLEEIGQLHCVDVKTQSGITFLSITDVSDDEEHGLRKHLKTESSRRRVPIHDDVLRLGFMEFVERQRQAGSVQLFPDLLPNTRGKLTSALSKRLNRFIDTSGISDSRKTFHSFRHYFKDLCRNAGLARDQHDALTGHTDSSVSGGYGVGHRIEILHEFVNRIEMPHRNIVPVFSEKPRHPPRFRNRCVSFYG
jgi:integrase